MVDHLTRVDAAILAGGPPSFFASHLPNKTFLKIHNRCLFAHVLQALILARSIRRVIIVGPKEAIERELYADRRLDYYGKNVEIIQESNNLIDNMFNAFAHSIGGYRPGAEDTDTSLLDRAILGVAGDAPLLIAEEVDQFVERCDTANYDYFFGMTTKEAMERFAAKPGHGGIRMAYSPFAEGLWRVNNLHLAKPFRIKNRQEFQAMYNLRHLRKIRNILKFAYELGRRGITADDWRVFANMFISMKLRKAGLLRVSEWLRERSPMAVVTGGASKILGTRATIVLTDFGGAALDVDKPSNAPMLEAHFDEWIALQKSQAFNGQ